MREGGDEDDDRQSKGTDEKRLAFLREEVGEKGRCLKRGREIV